MLESGEALYYVGIKFDDGLRGSCIVIANHKPEAEDFGFKEDDVESILVEKIYREQLQRGYHTGGLLLEFNPHRETSQTKREETHE